MSRVAMEREASHLSAVSRYRERGERASAYSTA
jgi:hypothetical protein